MGAGWKLGKVSAPRWGTLVVLSPVSAAGDSVGLWYVDLRSFSTQLGTCLLGGPTLEVGLHAFPSHDPRGTAGRWRSERR